MLGQSRETEPLIVRCRRVVQRIHHHERRGNIVVVAPMQDVDKQHAAESASLISPVATETTQQHGRDLRISSESFGCRGVEIDKVYSVGAQGVVAYYCRLLRLPHYKDRRQPPPSILPGLLLQVRVECDNATGECGPIVR